MLRGSHGHASHHHLMVTTMRTEDLLLGPAARSDISLNKFGQGEFMETGKEKRVTRDPRKVSYYLIGTEYLFGMNKCWKWKAAMVP